MSATEQAAGIAPPRDVSRAVAAVYVAFIGSVTAIPSAGTVISRIGEARTIAFMCSVLCVGLVTIGIGYELGTGPVCIGLFLLGFGNGAWDVAMNVQGATVERALGRSIMSRFHAGFSVGTVAPCTFIA